MLNILFSNYLFIIISIIEFIKVLKILFYIKKRENSQNCWNFEPSSWIATPPPDAIKGKVHQTQHRNLLYWWGTIVISHIISPSDTLKAWVQMSFGFGTRQRKPESYISKWERTNFCIHWVLCKNISSKLLNPQKLSL